MHNLIDGIAFAIALLGILGIHETAHYYAAKKHEVKSTLPYFIPAPTLIGTFGAVINVKSPIPDKNSLFDLGIQRTNSRNYCGNSSTNNWITFFNSSTTNIRDYKFVKSSHIVSINIRNDATHTFRIWIAIHPLVFAGWVGIIVTLLNLMPVAFLDGGHIVRSLFTEKIHRIISIIGVLVTLDLGWIPMAILMMLILVFNKRHTGALDNVSKLTT